MRWKTRPSALMALDDPYAAYCADEACAYIAAQIERKRSPRPRPKDADAQAERTGNAGLIEQLLRETHQKNEAISSPAGG